MNVSVIYLEPRLRSQKHFMSMKNYETKMCKVLTHCPTALTQDSEVILKLFVRQTRTAYGKRYGTAHTRLTRGPMAT